MKTMKQTIMGVFVFLMLMTVMSLGGSNITVKAACSHRATGKWQITKKATCDSYGTKVMKCKNCGYVLQTSRIEKLGHNWGAYKTTAAPTCTSVGSSISRCTRCSATRPGTIPATGHNPSNSYTVTKKATCTKDGTKVRKCTKCSANLETKSIEKLGHKWGTYKVTKKATCTTDGSKKRTCSVCNKSEKTKIPAFLKPEVLKYKSTMAEYAKENGISKYVDVLLAIMQVETGGDENSYEDVMQSSESLGQARNSLDTESSIKQGCVYFAELLQKCKNKEIVDVNVVIQSYNYGPEYINYVASRGKKHTFNLAKNFAYEKSGGKTKRYNNEIAKAHNYTWRYAYGNMFYVELVNQCMKGK